MALLIAYFLVASASIHVSAFSIPSLPHISASAFLGTGSSQHTHAQAPLQDGLEAWLAWEEKVALHNLLDNIAPNGQGLEGAIKGSVLASPSREHPNYFYQWVRDAAITTSTLVDTYADDPSSKLSAKLSSVIDDYAVLQSKLQHTSNPSGTFEDLSGLGEPKFEADGSAFVGSWGRPQRDGPALRAITLMAYLRAYNASHPSLWTSNHGSNFFGRFYEASLPANSIIKADLEYTSHYWNHDGFDLWEEVEGLHFFTAMVQLRALREGSDFALAFGDNGAAKWYASQAEALEKFVTLFWDKTKGHLVETLNSPRSGLDCALLLGSLHGYPSEQSSHEPVYAPHSDEALVSLLALMRDQRTRFPINIEHSSSENEDDVLEGVGLGRYPEDVYNGYDSDHTGHPWFLCTSSAAEILYRTASHISTTSNLTISSLGFPFYKSLLSSSSLVPEIGSTYGPNDAVFHSVVDRLRDLGDGFLEVVKRHASAEGNMSEQFDRRTGFQRGARDLTWSYGAFLQAVRARERDGEK
ncbi:glucoamylase I precursor [Dendryphion nanum]|uniref:glucan 1,4-alpha-glucosidase n=1 Tax=Dendryphion nanum TaxID=256645 RepID=A0A9P9E4A5_9PLEO|nr:glucoamylase I precursor [Dendryphion nanum]